MNILQLLLPKIESFHFLGYWIAFLAVLLETVIGIGLFIPGSTIMLFMGALAARGYLDIGDLLWFAAIGAILGDNINYFIGKKYGRKIFTKGFWFVKPKHFKKGENFFENHGSKSVFFGRFVPSLKEIMPLIAGIFGMKRLTFMTWNILGAIGWSLAWVLPGYFFSKSLDFVKIWLTRAGLFLTIVIAVFVILYILKIFLVRKGKQLFSFFFSIWKSIKQAIIENEEVKGLVKRHRTFFWVLKKRLSKDSFYGMPLTLFSIALFYVILHFGGIVEDVVNSDVIVSADVRVANLLAIFRNEKLTKIFLWITLLGKWQIVLIFIISAVLILWLREKKYCIPPFLLCVLGSQIFTFTGKFIFHRPRPGVAIYPESSFSFPSGHASIAVVVYGFFTYLLIKMSDSWQIKVNAFFTGFILIIMIGFSRLYLGVHYVSDVWGGYLVGAIWLIIAIGFSEYFSYKKEATGYQNLREKLMTIGIIVVSIALYTIFSLNYEIPASPKDSREAAVKVRDAMRIFKTERSKYTESLLGEIQEPLSFIIVTGDDQQFIKIFQQSGWVLADEVSFLNTIKLAYATFRKMPYPSAPMTPDFWETNVHDFGFEKSTELNSTRTRHHARFWKTNYTVEGGGVIYVGTASFDSGMKWGVVHRINPDIDTEREVLYNDLMAAGNVNKAEKYQFVNPKMGSNFSGDPFFTDGKLYLITVKGE